MARDQPNEAKWRMQEDSEANENYAKLAMSSAGAMIRALNRGLNADIPNMEIQVEFY